MFKFLRKYSKWILAVGGTLLMITFLVPQAIQSLSQRAAMKGATWARIGEKGEKVPADTLRQAQSELQVLEELGQGVPFLGPMKDAGHWYLLVREADQAGLVGAYGSDVLPAEQMKQLISATNNPARTVDEAIGKWLSVGRMLGMYTFGSRLSDQRLRAYAQRLFHGVEATIVPIKADATKATSDPTEDAILAQFEKYADVEPGAGDRGFGYRLPDRFHLEWLTISGDDIRALAEASDEMNGITLAKHWRKYESERGFPTPDANIAVPDVVREDLLNDLTTAKRAEIVRDIQNAFLDAWRPLPITADGVRVVPPDWANRRIALADLAETIVEKQPTLALPAYHSEGNRWLTVNDLVEFTELNTATTDKFGRPVPTRTLLTALREFDPESTIPVQAGLAMPPLQNAAGDLVIVRVIDVDPARPPHDADEVRGQLVEDLRRVSNYDALLARATEIEAQALESGLLYVAVENDAEVQRPAQISLYDRQILDLQINNNIPLGPMASGVPGVGQSPEAVEAIVERALAMGSATALGDLPPAERTFILPVDDAMTLAVVRLEQQFPLDQARFDQLCALGLEALVLSEEIEDTDAAIESVFGYDALAERHQFVLQRSEDDEEDEATLDETADESASTVASGS